MDGMKVALGNRGMIVEAARKIGKSGEPWGQILETWCMRGKLISPIDLLKESDTGRSKVVLLITILHKFNYYYNY